MKKIKNIIATFMTVCMLAISIIPSVAVLAAEKTTDDSQTELPNDAVILYEDEDVVMYQSKEESIDTMAINARSENNYGNAWVNKGGSPGSFDVYNTHKGKLGVTWKVEASSRSDYAQIYMTKGDLVILATRAVNPADGDVRFVIKNGLVGYYTVHYIPVVNSNGMRVMCWTYSV